VTNYDQDNALMSTYGSQGFTVLGFPCAQFDNQEPGTNAEIPDCLKYVRPGNGYVAQFPLFSKSDVNGQHTSLVYKFLKVRCKAPSPLIGNPQYIQWYPVMTNDITWNFEKFLLDRNGNVYKRYTPSTDPALLVDDIEYLLGGGSAVA